MVDLEKVCVNLMSIYFEMRGGGGVELKPRLKLKTLN